MRRCQADYFRFCTDPDYTPLTWPDDYWPDTVAPPSDDAWARSLKQFQEELDRIIRFVQDPSIDLAGEIPHAERVHAREEVSYHGTTYAEEISTIADHNAYHLGQFVTVRRLLDAWPPGELETPVWEK